MLSYESYFLIMLVSILGPVLGVVVMFFYHILEKQTSYLEMQNREISLEKELEVRRYMQLHQQIQPHFLFNALNSLYSLLRLGKYSELSKSFEYMILHLRVLYDKEKGPLCKINDEISHTENYLKIQNIRFGERLQVTWSIEEDVGEKQIIRFLLQTLVENAFKHGLEQVERDFLLNISLGENNDGFLKLQVEDNGPGFYSDPFINPKGVGLTNVKKQLHFLYGENAELTVRINGEGEMGGEVTVIWPDHIIKSE